MRRQVGGGPGRSFACGWRRSAVPVIDRPHRPFVSQGTSLRYSARCDASQFVRERRPRCVAAYPGHAIKGGHLIQH